MIEVDRGTAAAHLFQALVESIIPTAIARWARPQSFQPIGLGWMASIPDRLCRTSRGGGQFYGQDRNLDRCDIGNDGERGRLRPAVYEIAANECVLDSTKDSGAPLAKRAPTVNEP